MNPTDLQSIPSAVNHEESQVPVIVSETQLSSFDLESFSTFFNPDDDYDPSNPNYHLPNAFNLFIKIQKTVLLNEYPNAQDNELLPIIGQQWRKLSDETKDKYRDLSHRIREGFMSRHPEYIEAKTKVPISHRPTLEPHPVLSTVLLEDHPIQ